MDIEKLKVLKDMITEYIKVSDEAEKLMIKRMNLEHWSTRARITTINAKWTNKCETRDRLSTYIKEHIRTL